MVPLRKAGILNVDKRGKNLLHDSGRMALGESGAFKAGRPLKN